jgi:hypothetical protein
MTPSVIEPATFQLVSARFSISLREHFISYVFFPAFCSFRYDFTKMTERAST